MFIIALSSGLQSILGEQELKQLVPLGPQSEGTSMHATCCSASTVYSPGSPSGNGTAHSGWVFPHQLMIKTTPYTHTQKPISWVIRASVKFTVNSTCSSDLWEKDRCTKTHRLNSSPNAHHSDQLAALDSLFNLPLQILRPLRILTKTSIPVQTY